MPSSGSCSNERRPQRCSRSSGPDGDDDEALYSPNSARQVTASKRGLAVSLGGVLVVAAVLALAASSLGSGFSSRDFQGLADNDNAGTLPATNTPSLTATSLRAARQPQPTQDLPATTARRLTLSTTPPQYCYSSTEEACYVRLSGSMLGITYSLGLIDIGGTCGTDTIVSSSVFDKSKSAVVTAMSTETFQLHNMGTLQSEGLASYKLCFCTSSTCTTDASFSIDAGTLAITTVTTSVVYPYSTLAFDVTVNCGDSSNGQCSASSLSRYKLMEASTDWSYGLGCGHAAQSSKVVSSKNCYSATDCHQVPSSKSASEITWTEILVAGEKMNNQQVATNYEVCFCDDNCGSPLSWYKVGEVYVRAPSLQGPVSVNTRDQIRLLGSQTDWSSTGNMKVISDTAQVLTDSDCFDRVQSSKYVLGHTCSSTTSCAAPDSSGNTGNFYENIAVTKPGAAAICYCDESCTYPSHWFMLGWVSMSGPATGQFWTTYTDVSISITLKGWSLGLANRIRIIAEGGDCSTETEASSQVITSTSSPTMVTGSEGTVTGLASITGGSEVLFDGDHGLKVGDRVTLTGFVCAEGQENLTCSEDTEDMFNREHTIVSVPNSTAVGIAVAFEDDAAYPDMTLDGVSWVRSDRQTFGSMRIVTAGRYTVCWRAATSVAVSTSSVAGTMLVTDPPSMTSAALHLSSREPDVTAPVVLAFTTTSNSRYTDALEAMRVKLLFSSPSMLFPAWRDKSAIAADADHDTLEEADQTVCGKMFLELDSDSNLGFPTPSGCYLVQEATGTAGTMLWAFYLVFSKKNGLAPSSTYRLVFNAVVSESMTTGTSLIDIVSMDDVINKPTDILEVGNAKASKALLSSSRTSIDPLFDISEGVTIEGDSSTDVQELPSTGATIQVQLKGNASYPIKAGDVFRLIMRPLLQWNLGGACAATCTTSAGTTCGSMYCSTAAITGNMWNANVFSVMLPSTMTSITDTVMHDLKFTSLKPPIGGFFPSALAAEVQASKSKRPHYVETVGKLLYVPPTYSAALVVASGDGNGAPFKGDTSNVLYAKVVMASVLYAASTGDATLTISLPLGYDCISTAEAPSTLSVFGSSAPSSRGKLATLSDEGAWTTTAGTATTSATCVLTLGAGMAVWADSPVYLAVTVNNPEDPLPESSSNVWRLQAAGKGAHTDLMELDEVDFASTDSGFGSSVSVLGKILDAVVYPLDLGMGSDSNWLNVFFRPEQAVDAGGSVTLMAPSPFDFGEACVVHALPDQYYESYTFPLAPLENEDFTIRLPFTSSDPCVGIRASSSSKKYSKAKISLATTLRSQVRYGFQVRVANAGHSYTASLDDWRISTASASGSAIDGSTVTARLNGDSGVTTDESWALKDESHLSPYNFGVFLASAQPSGSATTITLSPIVFSSTTGGPIKVLAPAGYKWDFASSDFVYQAKPTSLAVGDFVEAIDQDLPIASVPTAPSSAPYNELTIALSSGLVLQSGVRYGFSAKVVLPDASPTGSMNYFLLTAGGADADAPSQALLAEAPRIQRIFGLSTSLNNSAAATSTWLSLDFETLTTVPANGGFIALGPATFSEVSSESCALTEASTASAVAGVACEWEVTSGNVTIKVTVASELSRGTYALTLPVTASAATSLGSSPGDWKLHSVSDVTAASASSDDTAYILDYPATATGVRVNAATATGSVVTGEYCWLESRASCLWEDRQYQMTGRSDRPGETNSLIFSLSLTAAATSAGTILIKAPLGFEWAEECNVTTAATEVFGESSTLPSTYTEFPNVTVTSCIGHGRMAAIDLTPLDAGFQANTLYAFRVDWVRNPAKITDANQWTIEFNGETTGLVAGFPLWNFESTELYADDTMEGATNIISWRFTPTHEIPAGGYLEIKPPAGFAPNALAFLLAEASCTEAFPICQSDATLAQSTDAFSVTVTSSNTVQVKFTTKVLSSSTSYVLQLSLGNPEGTTAIPGTWSFATYRYLSWIHAQDTYEAMDSISEVGFLIEDEVTLLCLDTYPAANGAADVDLPFTLRFAEPLYVSDVIRFEAPSGYLFEADSSGICSTFVPTTDALPTSKAACTSSTSCYGVPKCSEAGVILWELHRCPAGKSDICVLSALDLKFTVASANPTSTPSWNRFSVKHLDKSGSVFSSKTTVSYRIYPLLQNFTATLDLSDGEHFQAVGSEATVILKFTVSSTEASQFIAISGVVAGESFRFTGLSATDGATGKTLPIRVSLANFVVIEREITASEEVTVILTPLQNPSVNGVSSWTVTTYKYWNSIQGLRYISSQILTAPGFSVLGFVSAQGIGSLTVLEDQSSDCLSGECPAYFGDTASLNFAFQNSVATPVGSTLNFVAPPNHWFISASGVGASKTGIIASGSTSASAHLILGNGLMTASLTVVGGGSLAGSWALSVGHAYASTSSAPVFKHATADLYLFYHASSGAWVFGPTPSAESLNSIAAVGRATVASSSDAVPSSGWTTRSSVSASWAASSMAVYGDATVTGDTSTAREQVTMELGRQLPALSLASLKCGLALPTLSQVVEAAASTTDEYSWLIEAKNSAGDLFATNDQLFTGFTLVQKNSFVVTPSLQAPMVRTTLTLAFDQTTRLYSANVANPTYVRYELTGPDGYEFVSDCLSTAEKAKKDKLFSKCTGVSSLAGLISLSPSVIKGTREDLTVELLLDIAESTPDPNIWTLEYFLQGSGQRSGYGEVEGFEVISMPVIFYGNNQLATSSVNWFAFTPSLDLEGSWKLLLEPPENSDYELSCSGFSRGTLSKGTTCADVADSASLVMTLPTGATLSASTKYFFGVAITTPIKLVLPDDNMWRLSVQDSSGATRDSSAPIAGMTLTSSYLSVGQAMSFDEQVTGTTAWVSAQVSIALDTTADEVASVHFIPPDGVTIGNNKTASGWSLASTTIDSTGALVLTSTPSTTLAAGTYAVQMLITLTGEALTLGRSGGLWLARAYDSDDVLVYQQAISGFS